MKLVTRATIAVGLGTALAIAPATLAMAADHEATVIEGSTSISLDLGAEAANARTGIVIIGFDADASNPADSDVVYANEVSLDQLGTASLKLTLPSIELEGYRILANYEGGKLYSAPLAGEEVGDGGTGGDTGGDTGGAGDGTTEPGGNTDPGGSSGTGGNTDAGNSTGETPAGTDPATAGSPAQLSETGASAGWITAAAVGALAIVGGALLFGLKRRKS